MKQSTRDQIAGDLHKVTGNVKTTAGQVTGNPDLESEGKAENLAGHVQKTVGRIEKAFESKSARTRRDGRDVSVFC
jgi:uncharacterized protein YjbJ (UPF0337 family)